MSDIHPDMTETDPEEVMLDLVEKWHAGAGGEKPLSEYLGLSREEYAAWVEGRLTDEVIVPLIRARAAGEEGGS
jgi:hypothetical protein